MVKVQTYRIVCDEIEVSKEDAGKYLADARIFDHEIQLYTFCPMNDGMIQGCGVIPCPSPEPDDVLEYAKANLPDCIILVGKRTPLNQVY